MIKAAHTESHNRVTDLAVGNMHGWVEDMNLGLVPRMTADLKLSLNPLQLSQYAAMTAKVTAFIRANPSADFSTVVLMQSYDVVQKENPEKAKVASLTLHTFASTLKRVCDDGSITRICQLVQLYLD
jgi:hypothetical protein